MATQNPNPPTALTATADTGEILLAWTAPTAVVGADITGYHYRITSGGITGADAWQDTGNTDTEVVVPFRLIANYQNPTFEVRSVATNGQSTATAVTLTDTIFYMVAVFGTPIVQDERILDIPLTLSSPPGHCSVTHLPNGAVKIEPRPGTDDDVSQLSLSVFNRTNVGGDIVENQFRVSVQLPEEGEQGGFMIDILGTAFCQEANRDFDIVHANARQITYDLTLPQLIDYRLPARYTLGVPFNVFMKFNTDVTFINPTEKFGSMDATFLDHFILQNTSFGSTPQLRHLPVTDIPAQADIPDEVGDTVPATWKLVSATTDDATATTEAGRVFLLRWDTVDAATTGAINITLKPESVRGPFDVSLT